MKPTKLFYITAVMALFIAPHSNAGDVRLQLNEVKDTRTTGEHFANLEVSFRAIGDDIDDAKALKITVEKATDDTGRNLIKEKQNRNRNEFKDLEKGTKLSIELKNPSRKAVIITEVSGQMEIFTPQNDPDSIFTFDGIALKPKVEISNDFLKENQIEFAIVFKEEFEKEIAKAKEVKKGDDKGAQEDPAHEIGKAFGTLFEGLIGGLMGGGKNGVTTLSNDPQSKIVKIEFLDNTGKIIENRGTTSMGKQKSYNFDNPLPKDAKLRIYVATSKSVVKLPFSLKDLALP